MNKEYKARLTGAVYNVQVEILQKWLFLPDMAWF